MVLFLLSKALYPEPPFDCDNKKLADVKQICGVYATGEFLTVQKMISTEITQERATRDLKVASLFAQLSKGRERVRKNIIKNPNTPMFSMLFT